MKLTDDQIERLAAEHYANANNGTGRDSDRLALISEFRHDFNTAKRRAYIYATRELLRDAMVLASK